MNAIETKLLNSYREFTNKNGVHYPVAVNVLVMDNHLGTIHDDCVYITLDGKSFSGGTQCVKGVDEIISLLSNVDFLPSDYNTREEYEEEISKYRDDDFYFRNTRFGFNILDIQGFSQLPVIDNEPIIGEAKNVQGGITYISGETDNGYCYKNLNAIRNRVGICYIAECVFDENGQVVINGENINKLIEEGGVETYVSAADSVRAELYRLFPVMTIDAYTAISEEFVAYVTDDIFNTIDYQCFGTELNEIDLEVQLDMFLAEKFVEFAKRRLTRDKDDTDLTNPNFKEELFDYLGQSCYRHNDFSLTDWDRLIDRWEDEPNY